MKVCLVILWIFQERFYFMERSPEIILMFVLWESLKNLLKTFGEVSCSVVYKVHLLHCQPLCNIQGTFLYGCANKYPNSSNKIIPKTPGKNFLLILREGSCKTNLWENRKLMFCSVFVVKMGK